MPEWTIRLLETHADIEPAEELQSLVWPGSDLDVIPSHLLITAAHNGGLVLGAYAGSKLVGMLFGFTGLYESPTGLHPKHCSHQLGIHPDYRNLGIGFALKQAQLEIVRAQGLELVTWTYDPLLSANAHLNIARLGAVCNTYLREVYGTMRDGMNAGLASDRFQVDWWINTPRVRRRLGEPPPQDSYEKRETHILYEVGRLSGTALLRPPKSFVLRKGPLLLAEIPTDFLKLKAADAALAGSWRAFTREAFEACFKAGYQVQDFIEQHSDGRRRGFYVLGQAGGKPE